MTSIDWLINQITEDQIIKAKNIYEWEKVFEQAKEMHKQEIIKSFEYGVSEGTLTDINYLKCKEEAEYYYNETFKKD